MSTTAVVVNLRLLMVSSAAALLALVAHAGEQKTAAPNLKPSRTVEATTISSTQDPAVRITVPKDAHYVGAARWILYDVADCEIHLFVEADADKTVKRWYWVQFEGYIPSRPDLKYAAKDNRIEKIGGLDFQVRARFGPTAETPKRGSDYERVVQLLQANGYKLPAHMMNARFMHFLDEAMRKELMIIISEDLAPTGYTSDQLIAGNAAKPEWTPIGEAMIQRAKAMITIKPLDAAK
jgi:hypothetical protein